MEKILSLHCSWWRKEN